MDRQGPRIATLTTATVLLVALGGAAATAVDKPKEPSELTLINTGVGQVLADENGNPLYLRLADKPDRPECAGECATTWPAAVGFPTKATGVVGETAQTPLNAANSDQPHVIYNTHPLYYYKNDRPNQPQGQNVDGFSLVSADGKAVTDRSKSAATAPLPVPSKAKPSASKTPKVPKPPTPATSAGDRVPGPRSTPAPTRTPPRITPRPPTGNVPQAPAATSTRAPAAKPVAPVATVAPVAPVQPSARGSASTGTGTGTGTSTGTGTGTGTGTSTAGTSTGKDTVPGPSVGALQITPSGAARGGADHLIATDSVRTTGAPELTLAIGATAAAALGTILVVRRHTRRATGDHH
ncbi:MULTISPECIES: hypothetical protein [unclassified Streptomyces]|uniref:hypothetical protein n=1 Tax=unclassified Streptomyces TaxID=2593676 RepID=UPI00081EE220|nr:MULTISPECIES: hypothetical protein [unclassified Streptomyces]MYZ38703.1 hypothetical protein [Streptomyces sp. SID4917]SCF99941.1 Secreted repeat of unknown function [Streptomyces sp. MnatMP-M17]